MQETVTIEKSVILEASISKVWAALTDEKELSQWWNKGVRLEAKVGGDFYEPWGKNQLATGKVIKIEDQKMIQFTWHERSWGRGKETICSFFLQDFQGKTSLKVIHSGWETFKNQKEILAGFHKGWDALLVKLEERL